MEYGNVQRKITNVLPNYLLSFLQHILIYRKNVETGQYVEFTETSDNMTSSFYNAQSSNKIIIHGYYSDMFLDVLVDIKTGL